MSSLSLSGNVFWLRTTLAAPVSVATLPIGSANAAGSAAVVGAAAGAGGAGAGVGGGCACASRTTAVAVLASSIVSATAYARAGFASTRLANTAIIQDDVRRAVPALDPPSRGVVLESCMSAFGPLQRSHFCRSRLARQESLETDLGCSRLRSEERRVGKEC